MKCHFLSPREIYEYIFEWLERSRIWSSLMLSFFPRIFTIWRSIGCWWHLQFIKYQYCSFIFYSYDILFCIWWLALDINSKVRKCLLCCLFHEELHEHLTLSDLSSINKTKALHVHVNRTNFFCLPKINRMKLIRCSLAR